ncbi:hypothetical protein ACUXV3_10965 [Roseobacteraceae bacterium NS-SX3]
MSEAAKDHPPIWEAFCSALGTEHREAKEIHGASGLSHPVEAIGVDEKGKRVVLISGENNPRITALMRGDVQATMPDLRVLVARPLAVDLAHAARKMFFTEHGSLNVSKLITFAGILQSGDKSGDAFREEFGETADQLIQATVRSALPVRSHILNLVDQLGAMDWTGFSLLKERDPQQLLSDVLTRFAGIDNLAGDREQGICPIPTYELTEADWDLFSRNKEVDEIQSRLKDLGIFQYFYPPADELALGMVDRGFPTNEKIVSSLSLAEEQGHLPSANTLIPEVEDLPDLLNGLKAHGYIVEGEFSTELTEEGQSARKLIRLRPREGVIAKLSRLISVSVDLNLKDLTGSK